MGATLFSYKCRNGFSRESERTCFSERSFNIDNLGKSLASKDDIQSLKHLIEEQNTTNILLNKRVGKRSR